LGHDLHVYKIPHHLFNGLESRFSLYGKIGNDKCNHIFLEQYLEHLNDRYYDIIIFPTFRYDDIPTSHFWNNLWAFKNYKKENIHFIDGADDPFIMSGLEQYGTMWKRELRSDKHPGVKPISFAIPEECLVGDHESVKKEKLFGHVIPGEMETYIFKDEQSYYSDYRSSYFGKTWKKAGWDCLRHYEILANKCIPYFVGLENCPEMTMVDFPKSIIIETNELHIS
jgi:hypothetical protein